MSFRSCLVGKRNSRTRSVTQSDGGASDDAGVVQGPVGDVLLDLGHGLGRGDGSETVVAVRETGVRVRAAVPGGLRGLARGAREQRPVAARPRGDARVGHGLQDAKGHVRVALLCGQLGDGAGGVGDAQGEDRQRRADVVDGAQQTELSSQFGGRDAETVGDVVGVGRRLDSRQADERVGKGLHLCVRATEKVGACLALDRPRDHDGSAEVYRGVTFDGRRRGRRCRRGTRAGTAQAGREGRGRRHHGRGSRRAGRGR